MRYPFLKKFTLITLAILLPAISQADLTKTENKTFQTECVKAWMERAGNTSDAVSYKNFGEKFCECGAAKPLDSKSDISHAAQVCMSEVLLHVAMDDLEDQEGLASLTQDRIEKACQDEWNIIYPDMDPKKKTSINTYCQCASPKLMDLNKERDNYTDKQWYEKMNTIADECANTVEADKTTTNLREDTKTKSTTTE